MSVSTLIVCPFCGENNARYERLREAFAVHEDKLGAAPEGATHGAIGTCYHCKNTAILYFTLREGISFPNNSGTDLARDKQFDVVKTQPEMFNPEIPENIPVGLHHMMQDADQPFRNGLFAISAQAYGNVLDVALNEICLPEDVSTLPIGAKIKAAKRLGKISEAIGSLLEGANTARIIGAHYIKDATQMDAKTARELTVAFLENAYTFPKRVELIRDRLASIKGKESA